MMRAAHLGSKLGCALAIASITSITSVASVATADPASARRADKLFREAADALSQKRFDEACPKLEESNRLERAVGTEYNLAVCYELSQRPASARRTYVKAAAFAMQSGKETAAKEATDRAKKLDSVVPRLVLRTQSTPAGVTVRCDEQTLDVDTWHKPLELDPGSHRVVVSAPGFTTLEKVLSLVEGETRELPFQLEALPTATPVGSPRPGGKPDTDRAADPETQSFPWRWVGVGVAAVGVVGVGVGGYFALHAKSASDASGCTDGRSCPDEASADRLRSAKSDADLATVLFIAGGALAVTGGVIFLVAPSKSGAAVSLSGAASRELTGVRVIGRW